MSKGAKIACTFKVKNQQIFLLKTFFYFDFLKFEILQPK